MNQNQTGNDIKQGFDAMAGGVKEAGRKRTAEIVSKKGYVAFKNLNAVAQFHADPYYVNWSYTFVDGEYRFFPPKKENEQIELYDARNMSLSNEPERRIAQEKMLVGEPLKKKTNYAEGYDKTLIKLGVYECKPNHCYIAVSRETYEIYKKQGYINGFNEYLGEVKDANGQIKIDNDTVDWYLGGARSGYGDIIIECPADKKYFQPNYDNDFEVRHMKSSGKQNPVPFSMITNVFDLQQIKAQEQEKQQLEHQQNIEQDSQVLETYKKVIKDPTKTTFISISSLQENSSKCKYELLTIDKRTGEKIKVQELLVDFNGKFSMEIIPSLYNQLADGFPAIDYEKEKGITFQNIDNSKVMSFGNLIPEQLQLIKDMKVFVDSRYMKQEANGFHR